MKKRYLYYRNPIARPIGPRGADYKMDKEDYDALVEKFGTDSAKKIKEQGDGLEKSLNEKYQSVITGAMQKAEFEEFKTKEITALNTMMLKMEKSIDAQGIKINELISTGGAGKVKSLEEWIGMKGIKDATGAEVSLIDRIKQQRAAGAGFFEIGGDELRAAGVHNFRGGAKAASINAINTPGTVGGTNGTVVDMGSPPGSPWLPGLGGSDLEMFEIVRNPNFIINRLSIGRTDQVRLAWINEVDYQGTPGTEVAESGTKPLTQHKFQVEYSTAKKAAARIALTEEFEQDVPGLATLVRRLLQQDVMRAFDDQLQANVIAAARPFEITGLNAAVSYANLWDAIGAMLAQVGYYNFVPNMIGLNSVTAWLVRMSKDTQGRYLEPTFLDLINRLLVEANKVAQGYALVGDLSQYRVDIYKDFTLRVGWINEQFINNEFSIVGELRYHSYISDNRKKALVYDSLAAVKTAIGTVGS